MYVTVQDEITGLVILQYSRCEEDTFSNQVQGQPGGSENGFETLVVEVIEQLDTLIMEGMVLLRDLVRLVIVVIIISCASMVYHRLGIPMDGEFCQQFGRKIETLTYYPMNNINFGKWAKYPLWSTQCLLDCVGWYIT